MLSALLSSIVPTFGIIAIGWLCREVKIWGKPSVDVMNSYAYYIALPALIFFALITTDISGRVLSDDFKLLGGVLLAHLIVVALLLPFLAMKKIKKSTRATLPMLVTFGSTAYLGIPYARFTFGNEGVVYASLLSVVLVVALLFVSIVVLNRFSKSSIKKDVLHTMLELPFLWAVLLGVLWPIFAFPELPAFAMQFIEILSDSAGPTALLGLGAFLFDIKPSQIPWGPTIFISVLKVALPTAVTVLVLRMLGISGVPLFVGTAMAATSTAVTSFILAGQYKLGQKLTAGVILVSVFTSLIALTIISAVWLA